MSTNYEALERAVNYIEENLNSKLSVDEVARAAYYSAPHLSWMFKDVTGIGVGDEALAAIVDSICEAVASQGERAPQFVQLVERLGLMRHGKPTAVMLTDAEFEIPKRFIESVYGAIVSWWLENEQQVDEILNETTASRLGIEHRHLYHDAWRSITAEAGVPLCEKGYLLDLRTLKGGAINAAWELSTNLQGEVFGPPDPDGH